MQDGFFRPLLDLGAFSPVGERHAYKYAHTRDRVCKPEDAVIRECFQADNVAVHLGRICWIEQHLLRFFPAAKDPRPTS